MSGYHLPICDSVLCCERDSFALKDTFRVPIDKLPQFAQVQTRLIPPPSLKLEKDKDKSTDDVCTVLKMALIAVDRRSNRTNRKYVHWWTSDYRAAQQLHKDLVAELERSI